jgi:hypothetical protein
MKANRTLVDCRYSLPQDLYWSLKAVSAEKELTMRGTVFQALQQYIESNRRKRGCARLPGPQRPQPLPMHTRYPHGLYLPTC